jgi:hypothetical protein
MARGPNHHLRAWERHQLELTAGRLLRWTYMPTPVPNADCFRLDDRTLTHGEARQILAAADHPHAELVRSDWGDPDRLR